MARGLRGLYLRGRGPTGPLDGISADLEGQGTTRLGDWRGLGTDVALEASRPSL
jgi:hypothetical protein